MIDALDEQMKDMRGSCSQIETDSDLCTEHSELSLFIKELGDRLDAFEDVQDRMDSYRVQLATLLGESEVDNSELNSEKPLPAQCREISRAIGASRLKGFGTQIVILASVVLALFSLLGWWQLSYNTDSQTAAWYTSVLTNIFGGWSEQRNHLLQISAIGFGAFAAIMIFLSMGLSRRIRLLKQEESKILDRLEDIKARAKIIDNADELPFTTLIEGLEKLNNEGISQLLQTYTQGMGQPFVNQLSLATEQDKLIDMLNACMNSVGDLRESIATEIGRHQRIIEESHERIEELDHEKEEMQQRELEKQELRNQIDTLATQTSRHEEHIETLKLAMYLLRETCRNIYSRFNQVLSKYTGKVMPKLTDNRYKQMQIGEDLSVRVFSQDKNDFGELEEFSSGTQRQMLLAVRLAMSKALIEAVEQDRQFIILDEPFAFFDRERIRASLAALPKVDKHLDQIWIITQEFEDLSPFSLHIECSRENEELIVGQYAG
jgi:exonuclease SbcC